MVDDQPVVISSFGNSPLWLVDDILSSCNLAPWKCIDTVMRSYMLITWSLQGVEDPLLELKTPTLFIIGSHSTLTSQEDVEVHFM